jgi:hypothetical protein
MPVRKHLRMFKGGDAVGKPDEGKLQVRFVEEGTDSLGERSIFKGYLILSYQALRYAASLNAVSNENKHEKIHCFYFRNKV